MIGCILTGHGTFARGMLGAVEMIAGPQENFETVPFLEELPLEEFEEQMTKNLEKLQASCDGIVIFSDLVGGTPFRTAMLASQNHENVEVIGGTNLPLLVEASLLRLSADNAAAFADEMIETGKNGMIRAQLQLNDTQEEVNEEEGI